MEIAGLEICSENQIRESIVRILFKNTVAVAVLCWYIKDAFTEFCQQIFEKKCFRGHLRLNWQKIFCPTKQILAIKGVERVELGESV